MAFLIFTDLDATLLNHDYTWREAQPALDLIREMEIPLILNSSKTLSEMYQITQDLGLKTPIIAENGGQVAIPQSELLSDKAASWLEHAEPHHTLPYYVSTQSPSRVEILDFVHRLRDEKGYRFTGFADMDTATISTHTGLDAASAGLSADRYVTEPIIWEDSEEKYAEFLLEIKSIKVRGIRGGRFIHLMGPADKADGMNRVSALFERQLPNENFLRIALGDSQNDAEMLDAADIAVVIPYGKEGHRISSTAPKTILAEHSAAAGWNASILEILNSKN